MVCKKAFTLSVLPVLYLLGQVSSGQLPTTTPRPALPLPTGPFSVGRVTAYWQDESRIEPLSATHEPRELMVDIWYPSEPPEGAPAAYLDVNSYERALGAESFQRYFGEAAEVIKKGVQTHAALDAPYSDSAKRSPVLIFSPGGGMVREVYATQLEDLASHGYVVAAISHPYDAIVTLFPGGKSIAYSDKRWPVTPSVEGEANLNQLEWHANDIRFVLDELTRANLAGVSSLPFAGHLDLDRVGAFGHSFGGIAAAHACQFDRRFKACLNEDGVVAKRPLFLDARGWVMDQAFMLILHDPATRPLTDEQVAQMKMSRQRIEALVKKLDADQEAALRNTGKGSYRVRLRSDKVSHMDFSDLPLLGARDRVDSEKRIAILMTVRSYTLAFFNQNLRGVNSELLKETDPKNEFVDSVERFEPARFPCPTQ
jgi:pimeloyl-ACP methyl ester carboxylesterase